MDEAKGGTQVPPLPQPATTVEMYLAAILDELKASRAAVSSKTFVPDGATHVVKESPPVFHKKR